MKKFSLFFSSFIFIILFSNNFELLGQCASSGNMSYPTCAENVTFNTINNTTGAKTAAYNNYTAQSTTVIIGNNYTLSVRMNTDGWTCYIRVWIDWNGNGTLNEAGEQYDLGSGSSNPTTKTLSVTVPAGAVAGPHRMRVSVKYNGYAGPCDTGYDGEVEDYTVNVQPNCNAPTSITTSVTPSSSCSNPQSVTFNVTGSSGGNLNGGTWQYQWQNGVTVLQAWSGTSSYTTSLSSSVTYTVYMRSTACTGSVSSGFNASYTLMTIPAQPSVINGLTSPCSGSSQIYSVTDVPGTTYTWMFPSGWTQTGGGTTNSVTATVTATAGNVQVTPSNACGSGTPRTLAVTPGAGPTVTVSPNPASVCGGVGVVITASGAVTYSWSPAAGLSATNIANPTATPATTTTYTVTETGSGCNNTASVQVRVGPTVSATASVNPTAVCPGASVSLTSNASQGAQTLLSATGDGGFEAGTSTLAANGWTGINTSPTTWYAGTAAGAQAGTKAAFIGTGASTYSGSGSAIVKHFYRDIAIPSGATNVYLNYYLKYPTIDNNYDYFYVYTTTTAYTPVSGTIPGAGYSQKFINTGTTYSAFTAMPQIDLSALAGTTVRLVFTFKNDGASPYANPAVDGISLIYTPPAATYSYTWGSSPAGYSSSSQNPTANPAVNTSYTVTVTQTISGCTAAATTAQVTMNPVPAQPVITGLATVCGGTAGVVYTIVPITYATSYTWSVPAGSTITAGQGTSSITVTFGSTSGNVSCYATDACSRNSTTANYAVTVLAAPGAPTTTGATACGISSVLLSASGSPAHYHWYDAPSGGNLVNDGPSTYNTPVISIPTTYYVATNNGSCDGPRTPVTAGIFMGGLDAYTVTRTTGITYADISGTGTAVASWKNGTTHPTGMSDYADSKDDNLSTPITIPFSFPFDGGNHTSLLVGLDGFITFNTATKADGADLAACGPPEPYTWQNDNFSVTGRLGTLQAIAPFYNDLYCNNAITATCYYKTDGSAPNRIFTVQWTNVYNDIYCSGSSCSEYPGNLYFQVKLYETSGNIEFWYGPTMTQTTYNWCESGDDCTIDDDYTSGLNSSTLSASPTISQLFTQQTANTATFNNTPQNGLTTLPTINSKIILTRTAPAAPTLIPSSVCNVIDNYPANGATNQCLNQILSWSPGDGSPTSYDVYFGTSNPPPFAVNTTQTFYNPGTLNMTTTYYWKIVPKNSFGAATNVQINSFATGVGDQQPHEITSNIGTLVSHVASGTDVDGHTIYTNTYEVCPSSQGAGTLTAWNYTLSEGSELDWTTPFYFFGWPIVQCTGAIPSDIWGNCDGGTQTPILT
ncbi:MAG: GEVED domain-containing protein, partial [Bacteroidota bacterium]